MQQYVSDKNHLLIARDAIYYTLYEMAENFFLHIDRAFYTPDLGWVRVNKTNSGKSRSSLCGSESKGLNLQRGHESNKHG